jgi:hypothetical protein
MFAFMIMFVFTVIFFIFFSSLYVFGEPAVHFSLFSPLLPLTEVSPQPSAIPGGNPSGDWQSAVGWGDTEFEPRTAGQQSGALPLSHHASMFTVMFVFTVCSCSRYVRVHGMFVFTVMFVYTVMFVFKILFVVMFMFTFMDTNTDKVLQIFLKCQNAGPFGIRSVRYRNEKTNDSRTSPKPERGRYFLLRYRTEPMTGYRLRR